jgi:hypothetical protein
VIDPEVPEAAKAELRSMPQAFLLAFSAQAPSASRRFRRSRVADAYHRRYVVPELDLDDDAQQAWERAATAARMIRRSQVVVRQFIDAVQVNTILPYLEWEIAEKLARLSVVRDRQRTALDGVDDSSPDVAPILDAQRHAQSLITNDIEQRIKRLQAIAELAANADDGIKREKAVRRLAQLNDSHLDMVAGLGPSGNEQAITEQASADLNVLIVQLGQAIRQASEAGARNLTLPGKDLCRHASPTRTVPPAR